MSRAVVRVWKVVIAAKDRARVRAERDLAAQRERYAVLIEAIHEANVRLDAAHAQRQALEDRISQLLTAGQGVSALTYIDHDRHREPLARLVTEARSAAQQAVSVAQAQACVVEQAAAYLRRAEAALDAARAQHKRAVSAVRRRVDELADEEAGEVAAARLQRGGIKGV